MPQPRILISRLSHIGDCILTLPLLRQIRTAFPHAHIVWAMEKPTDQLLQGHPDLDEVFIVPKDWMHRFRVIRSLRRQLREFRFDISIDPQAMLKSSALAWLSGTRTRIGLRGPRSRELSQFLNNRTELSERSHLVDRSIDLMRQFDQEPKPAVFDLPVFEKPASFIKNWMGNQGLQRPFMVINPGASWKSKMWETCRFGEVCQFLDSRGIQAVVTWAGASENTLAQEILQQSDGKACLAPPTNLQQLAELLRAATAYVGCDTGPMHIANAVGTTCIGLYGTTRPQDSGAYGGQHIHIQRWFQSGTCTQRRNAANDAMKAITVDDVCTACDQILSSKNRQSDSAGQKKQPSVYAA